MKFLDEAKIYLKSGDGGAGCVSFRREKFIEFGGPDGGNGGKGGDIIFKASDQLNTLIDFRYKQHFKAPKGKHGKGRNRTGHGGKDIIITVPVGTQILADDKETLLVDLTENGQTIKLLHGGRGGKGNEFFKSSTNRAPRFAQPGESGEEMWVWLQLKLIADVGLVGLPNAGKSTFLSIVSRAHPKIADYPFTTLIPMLGVVQPFGPGEGDFVVADLPGLIEGAHEGKGLGLRFLAHMERCAILLHLIDTTLDDVCQAYQQIRHEIESYGHGITQKPEIVALNKADAVSEEDLKLKKQQLEACTNSPIWIISCADQRNIQDLTNYLYQQVTNPQV